MCDKRDGLATTMEHSGKNDTNHTILLHLPLDLYSFFIMFLLEIETDHLLESYSNIAIGRIQLDQLDLADLSKSRASLPTTTPLFRGEGGGGGSSTRTM